MSVVRMPGCSPERIDDFRPWTEYKNLHEVYILSYEDAAEALAAAVRRQAYLEHMSGGKIISFTYARTMRRKAAREAAMS